jgi:dihydrofolate reductase
MFSIISAKAKNNVIGRNNEMPWHISEDLKYFKEKTLGHKIILGRKNFESLGKPLRNRDNIILTRDKKYKVEGAKIYNDVDQLEKDLSFDSDSAQDDTEKEEIFIVGGAEIYKLFLEKDLVDRMYITQLDQEVEGDVFFPEFDETKWKKVDGKRSTNGEYEYEFQVWEKL